MSKNKSSRGKWTCVSSCSVVFFSSITLPRPLKSVYMQPQELWGHTDLHVLIITQENSCTYKFLPTSGVLAEKQKTTKTKNTQNPAKMRNHSFGSMECQAKLTNWPSHWHCLWIKEHNESKERCKERMHSATFLERTIINETTAETVSNSLEWTTINETTTETFQTPLNEPSSMKPIIKLFQTPLNESPSVRPILKLFQTPLNEPSSMRPIIKLFQRHKQWGHIWETEFEHITRDFQGWANKIRLFIVHA